MSSTAFDELLRRLVEADVAFVVVGGMAVGAWGVVRATKDIDLVPDPDPANLQRLADAVVAIGGRVQAGEAFAGSARSILALLQSGERVFVETALGPVDVVHGLEGVPSYEELCAHAAEAEILGCKVRVCSREDLIAMKKAAGRTRDLADLEDLEAAGDSEA